MVNLNDSLREMRCQALLLAFRLAGAANTYVALGNVDFSEELGGNLMNDVDELIAADFLYPENNSDACRITVAGEKYLNEMMALSAWMGPAIVQYIGGKGCLTARLIPSKPVRPEQKVITRQYLVDRIKHLESQYQDAMKQCDPGYANSCGSEKSSIRMVLNLIPEDEEPTQKQINYLRDNDLV